MATGALTADARAIAAAVDIGGTKIAIGLVDPVGQVLARSQTPTRADEGFEAAMERVSTVLAHISAEAGVRPSGIGIGCTGPVDPGSGAIGHVEFLPGWQDCSPVAWLSHRFGLPVAMENDADAAALAESRCGTGRGKHSVIAVTVGTGIGAGLVVDGVLYRGVDGAHPELGHHVVDASGPLCSCGATGCWEALASGPAIAARYAAVAAPAGTYRPHLSAREICDLARAGHAPAMAEVRRTATYLGLGIANLVSLFIPDVIALSGSVMNSADLFLPTISDIIRRNCSLVPWQRVSVGPSMLGSDAPLIGAGIVWHHRQQRPLRER